MHLFIHAFLPLSVCYYLFISSRPPGLLEEVSPLPASLCRRYSQRQCHCVVVCWDAAAAVQLTLHHHCIT